MLSLAAVFSTTTPIALQDLAGVMSGASAAARWQAYLVRAPQGSVHAATLRYDGIEATGIGGLSPGDGSLVAIDRPYADEAESIETVNRAAKADLQMTRMPEAKPFDDAMPRAGEFRRPTDLFSRRDDGRARQFALASAHPAGRDFATRTARFIKPPAAVRAAPAREDAPAMVGSVTPVREGKGAKATLVAYAAPEAQVDAPFDAVIGNGAAPDISLPALQPRARPEVTNLNDIKEWMARRNRGKVHPWANNTLPKTAYAKKEQACLAQGIYFEARGESARGQAAVAQVILNRLRNPAYPSTICAVVYQNQRWRNRCQFSFACDGRRERVNSKKAWETAQKIAADVTYGRMWLPDVGDSTHYHATYVRPRWARKMNKTEKVGRHIFYRTKNGGWS